MKIKKRTILWTAIGACLEWYEFSIFMYVTPMISLAFFPNQDPRVALLKSFGLFAIGYLMRPIGGIIFGNLGDKLGRRKVLIISTGLMMLPMLGTTILPNYHQWGLSAVIILLLFRMLQGLSVGGEYTSVLTMILEHAPRQHRALTTSMASVISAFGVVLSASVVTLLIRILGNEAMFAWGWRIPFFIGFILSGVAFFCQLKIHESPAFNLAKKQKSLSKTPLLKAFKEHPKSLFYAFLITGFLGIPCYIGLAFFPNFLIKFFQMDPQAVMQITTLCTFIYIPFIPLCAYIADRVGRKPVLLTSTVLFIIIAYPAFMLINSQNLAEAFFGNALILIIYGCAVAAFITIINEFFPTEQRLSGVSSAYNIGNASIAGTTPLLCQFLISHTQSYYAPAWYLMIAAAITLCFIVKMPETLNQDQ